MKTINKISVLLVQEAGLIRSDSESRYSKETMTIIGENDEKICVDDRCFTTIDKKGSGRYNMYDIIDKPSISSYNRDTVFGSMVRYTLYTNKGKRKSTIKKEIAAHINKNYGGFFKLDWSVLDL